MSYLSRVVGATTLLLKAHAPTILVTTGVVCFGAGTILACKQTLKIEEVMEDHVPMLENIQTGADLQLEGYTQEHATSDRIKVYTRIGLDMAKLYAYPGILITTGIGLIFGGHRMLLRRNATLALAFTGLKKAFDAYRGRVVDQFGSEVDQGMLSGHVRKEVVDPETGKVETVHVRDWDIAETDPYNRVFAEGISKEWVDDLGINKMYVHNQQRFANQILNQKGRLYLSDVYKSLGIEENDISRVVGWKVKKNPDGTRDIPFVDFGLDKPHPDDWKYNQENAIYLDFNCQGLIVGGRVQKALEKA